MGRCALLIALVVGCVSPASVRCGDLWCPAGYVCAPSGDGCALQTQLDACDGVAADASCQVEGMRPGWCHGGYCQEIRCGDSIVAPGEVCDDGNTTALDGCSADCTSMEICGNGIPDQFLETCDDGNTVSGDGCSATCRGEIAIWRQARSAWRDRVDHAMVYDTVRQRVVLFGGLTPDGVSDQTWEFDGDTWEQRFPPHSPPARDSAQLAYDPNRRRVVLFGGEDPSKVALADTWEYDGTDWTQVATAAAPVHRFGGGMIYYPKLSRVVLTGGRDGGGSYNDTWLYDGVNWTPGDGSAPANGPSVLAYDAPRDRLVAFVFPGVTWVYTGTWSQLAGANEPRPRLLQTMTFDPSRNQVLMIGGLCTGFTLANCNDAFAFDGTRWTSVTMPFAPAAGASAYDDAAGKLVVVGGYSPNAPDYVGDTWTHDAFWHRRAIGDVPAPRMVCRMAYVPSLGGVVLFGGTSSISGGDLFSDTWLYRGGIWKKLAALAVPAELGDAAYDPDRQRLVELGFDSLPPTNTTSELDGQTWMQVTPASSPSVRSQYRLVFDEALGKIVLFGGLHTSPLADTWTYDGDWAPLATTGAPSGRYDHAMAYEPNRQAVVLFGGIVAGGAPDATHWELAGTAWTQRAIATPPARSLARLDYFPPRRSLVLFGGRDGANQSFDDTWEYRDGVWLQASTVGAPTRRWGQCSAYDPSLGKLVLFGGARDGDFAPLADTWLFGYE